MKFNDLRDFFKQKRALEIGGPSSLLNSLYGYLEDLTILNYKPAMSKHSQVGEAGSIVYGDATDESIINQFDNQFELIITSHTLEHIANPIKALKIWNQLLGPGGVILNIVPCKNHCWDRARNYTTFNHLVQDFQNNTQEDDMTHIHESACMIETRPNYYMDVGDSNMSRIIHHHVFDKILLSEIHSYAGFNHIFSDNLEDDPLQLTYIGVKDE